MARREAAASRGDVARAGLWSVLLGPPIIWAVRFGLAYALVPYACRAEALWLLHATSLLALAAVAACGLLARRYQVAATAAASEGSPVARRTRFVARFGLMASVLFGVVIIAEAIGNLMIDPCIAWGPLIP